MMEHGTREPRGMGGELMRYEIRRMRAKFGKWKDRISMAVTKVRGEGGLTYTKCIFP